MGGKASGPEAKEINGVKFVAQVLTGVSGKDLPALIDGDELALGLTNYASSESRLIAGKASGDIEAILHGDQAGGAASTGRRPSMTAAAPAGVSF